MRKKTISPTLSDPCSPLSCSLKQKQRASLRALSVHTWCKVLGSRLPLSLGQWVPRETNGEFIIDLLVLQVLAFFPNLPSTIQFRSSQVAVPCILPRGIACIQWQRRGDRCLLHLDWNPVYSPLLKSGRWPQLLVQRDAGELPSQKTKNRVPMIHTHTGTLPSCKNEQG